MFKSDSGGGDLNGFLDAGSHLQGDLHFEDTFRVDGKITGKVFSDGDLLVGEQGEVDGHVEVGRCYISGTVRGSIKTATYVEVTSQGKVYADIETPSLVLETGAFFQGHCAMGEASRQAPAGPESGKVVDMEPGLRRPGQEH